jgi:hypothetical protein
MSPIARPWAVYGISSALLLGALLIFAGVGWPVHPDSCIGHNCYCEYFDLADVNSGAPGIRQPVNTLFNLYALITAGIVAFVLSRDRAEGGTAIVIRSNSLKADGYVFAVLFLGLGSMWFHASLSATVAWLDGLSMYVYAAFLVFYTVDRWLGRRSASQLLRDLLFWIGWPLVAVGFTLLGQAGVPSPLLIGILVAVYALFEFVFAKWIPDRTARIYWIIGAVSMALAILFWLLSWDGAPLCFAHSWFQAHGLLWHPLAGVMAVFMFFYWRRESGEATWT